MKWRNVILISISELLAKSLWFSASAVIPQLTILWALTGSQQAFITGSVQLGFVIGAFLSAFFNLADRMDNRYFFAICAVATAMLNATIPAFNLGFYATLIFRFFTGAALASVYPLGMKLITSWCKEDRGTGLGLFIGAVTLGLALPHLINAASFPGNSGMHSWQSVMYISSALEMAAAGIILLAVREGPFRSEAAPFQWQSALKTLVNKPTRLANYGYLGHMWELYAMWAWAPILLLIVYERCGWSVASARMAGFFIIAIGSCGCLLAGIAADRFGRTTVTMICMALSGSCALSVGFLISQPFALTIVCLLWGLTVVADSAQFSSAVSELSDSRYIGTALTVQTCLGFLLTIVTIQIIPLLIDLIGLKYAFMVLAMGPFFGIANMFRLRRMPEAIGLASGNR